MSDRGPLDASPDPHRETLIRARHHRPAPNGTSLPDRSGATAARKQPDRSAPKPETGTPSVPTDPHRENLIRTDIADAARQPVASAAPQPKPRQRRRVRADGENRAGYATETPPTPAHAARNDAPDAPR